MPANIDSNKILFGDPPKVDELIDIIGEVYDADNISPALRLRIKRLLDRKQDADSRYKRLIRP